MVQSAVNCWVQRVLTLVLVQVVLAVVLAGGQGMRVVLALVLMRAGEQRAREVLTLV